MNDGIIIQARTGSTRLPNKILLPFYRDKCILDLLIEEIRTACPAIPIVVATSNRRKDEVIASVAAANRTLCFRGDENNVLKRFIDTARAFRFERIIRVCSDNPFLQASSFTDMLREADEQPADYIAYSFSSGLPTIQSHLGLFAEFTTVSALRRIQELTKEQYYREHVTNYLYTHYNLFSVRLLPLPFYLDVRTSLRLTLDTPEDFALLQELYIIYKEEADGDILRLLQIIDNNDDYRRRMLHNISNNKK